MPVQDDTTENSKNTAVQDFEEQNKPETILPLIHAVYDNYADKVVDLSSKKAEIQDRISVSQDKIPVLSEKADRLEATNEMIQQLMKEHKLPKAAKTVISANQARINRIRENQIPRLKNDISLDNRRIEKLDSRIETAVLKADKMKHLSGVIKSFAILNPTQRRKHFALHMDGMRACSQKLAENKLSAETEILTELRAKYEKTDSAVEKFDLSEKISKQSKIVRNLQEKLNDIVSNAPEKYEEIQPQKLDKAITHTEKQIESEIENDIEDLENLPDSVVIDSGEYLHNAEMAMEDDFDMIDGIINNGAKSEPEKEEKSAEKENKPKARQPKVKTINPDVYRAIPKEERLITNLPKKIATRVMDKLENSGIDYSAVEKKNGLVAVTVSKSNESPFRQAENDAKSDHLRYIHPEVYHSIPKEERFVQRMTESDARKIADKLEKANVPYSAVVNGANSAITVNKKNAPIATISRKQMHEQAQALKSEQKSQQKQKQKKQER
jgi:hypothetical protein